MLAVKKPNEAADIALLEELICSPCGLALERIEAHKSEPRPDFKLTSWRGMEGFCELKSPRDDWLDEQLARAEPGQIVGGLRSDPIFNRIARHIEHAVGQFAAVNPDRSTPNVLVFVNHDDSSHVGDLRETLTGHFHSDSGERYPTVTHISEGRLGEARYRIDLYIWIDANRRRRRVSGWFFSDAIPEHAASLRTLFRNARP